MRSGPAVSASRVRRSESVSFDVSARRMSYRDGGSAVDSFGPLLTARVGRHAETDQDQHGRAARRRERARQRQRDEGRDQAHPGDRQRHRRLLEAALPPRHANRRAEGEQDGGQRDDDLRPCLAAQLRDVEMHGIAGEDRGERAQRECRVGGTAEKIGARQFEGETEERREIADRVEQHDHEGDEQRRHLASKQRPGGEAEAEKADQRQRAEIDRRHVAREIVVAAPDLLRRRPPEFLQRPVDAIKIGHDRREQRRRVQRAARGAFEVDEDAIGLFGEHDGERDRDRDDDEAGDGRQRQGRKRAARRSTKQRADDVDRQDDRAEIGDLVATDQHEAGEDARQQAVHDSAALEDAREEQERDGEEREAEDLTDVLDAPGGGAAEREAQTRDERAPPDASCGRGSGA